MPRGAAGADDGAWTSCWHDRWLPCCSCSPRSCCAATACSCMRLLLLQLLACGPDSPALRPPSKRPRCRSAGPWRPQRLQLPGAPPSVSWHPASWPPGAAAVVAAASVTAAAAAAVMAAAAAAAWAAVYVRPAAATSRPPLPVTAGKPSGGAALEAAVAPACCSALGWLSAPTAGDWEAEESRHASAPPALVQSVPLRCPAATLVDCAAPDDGDGVPCACRTSKPTTRRAWGSMHASPTA